MSRFTLVPRQGHGRGYLSRFGRGALHCVGDPAVCGALVGWCRLVGDRPAEVVLGELEQLVRASSLVAVTAVVLDDEISALVYGGVPLYADAEGGRRTIANQPGMPPQIVSVGSVSALGIDLGPLPTDPLVELERGVVAADGFVLRRTAAVAAAWSGAIELPPTELRADPFPSSAAAVAAALPAPPFGPRHTPPERDRQDTESVSAAVAIVPLHDDAGNLPAAEPLPFASILPAGFEPNGEVMVHGLRCSRDHFNDPRARFCHACGIAMHQASIVLTTDVRPPLGVLVFTDGSYQQVSGGLVLGRDPGDDPGVRAGQATAVTLTDPRNTISRVHAEVNAVGWDVHVVDRGSTNGTFLWTAGSQSWERLLPQQPRLLDPGAHVAFGRLTATFESSLRPA